MGRQRARSATGDGCGTWSGMAFFRIAIPLYLIICASADALKPDGDIHDGINNV
jgi:hypothetical protein